MFDIFEGSGIGSMPENIRQFMHKPRVFMGVSSRDVTRGTYYSARSLRWPAVDTSDVQVTMVSFYAVIAAEDKILPAALSGGSNMF